MIIERVLVVLYLLGCIGIGVFASKKVLGSRDEYWVAGRRIGTVVNAMAIMASLASGGSIIGVMGLAYSQGIPATLALFAGAVLGFPIASLLVARPLRNFGRYTITDFLVFRYPSAVVRYLVPLLIVIAFTVYIVAQLKAAGITANALLGIPYETALTLATVVFILYVSIGGMIAITWTDVIQGLLMLTVILGTAVFMVWRVGSPFELMRQGHERRSRARSGDAPTGILVSRVLRDLGDRHSRHPPHRHAGVHGEGRSKRQALAQLGDARVQRDDSRGLSRHRAGGEAELSRARRRGSSVLEGDGVRVSPVPPRHRGSGRSRCRHVHDRRNCCSPVAPPLRTTCSGTYSEIG